MAIPSLLLRFTQQIVGRIKNEEGLGGGIWGGGADKALSPSVVVEEGLLGDYLRVDRADWAAD